MAADPSLNINVLDLLIIAGVGYGMFKGASDGLEKPAQRAALLAAAFCAIRFYTMFDSYLLNMLNLTPGQAPYVSGILIFVAVFMALNTLLTGLQKQAGAYSFLPNFSKAVGALWGGAKAVMLISLLTMGLAVVQMPPASVTANSFLYPQVNGLAMDVFSTAFKEVPILQKMIGEFDKIFRRKQAAPVEVSPNAPVSPKPTDVPATPQVQTSPTKQDDRDLQLNDRQIRDREVQIDRNYHVVPPTGNTNKAYPKYEQDVKQKVTPKQKPAPKNDKPPTVR